MTMRNEVPPLPDAAAREAIATAVDVNMVVEAAAGTGKTTSLVARLMTLFKQGALAGDARLAAVTFTHKAASELRERLERELNRVLDEPGEMAENECANLAAAAASLPECHIGTIHSLCARLLRERPVEAGIGLDFRELDTTGDMLLRREAWKQFAAAMRRGEHPGVERVFRMFRLDLEALAIGFDQFTEYPDVDVWPGTDVTLADVDVDAFAREVAALHAKFEPLLPAIAEVNDAGDHEAMASLQMLRRRWNRLVWPLDPAEALRLADIFKPNFAYTVWARKLGITRDAAGELKKEYSAFLDETVAPLRRDCLAAIYGAAMAAFHRARDIYDYLRRERRELNFQDLLLLTARLLREYPDVRADLAGRFPRLLVDEVQDTDPVQAEILFLLAGTNATEKDWRRCRPRPGSLFIVGDPKQSIYRFRRADIAVYQEMKRLLTETGGRVLGLTSNFRSQPSILEWVNKTYRLPEGTEASPEDIAATGRFSRAESRYGPEYMDLLPGRKSNAAAFTGVYYLESRPSGLPRDSDVRTEDLAARVAAFIRHAVDSGLPLPDGESTRPARPEDFLIITYRIGQAPAYADAVRRQGLSCRVTSGATLANSPSLAMISAYLKALAAPDDPVLWTAVLRGALFGVDDARLYRWKKAGGAFHLLAPLPPDAETDLTEIFRLGRRHLGVFQDTHPVAALEKLLGDLGLWPFSCLGPAAASEAGVLAAMVELLQREAGDIATAGGLAERLEWLMQNYDEDPLPAESPGVSSVRVMNLHKTKGLEAPVVFLTCTDSTRKSLPPAVVVRRGETVKGALCLRGPGANSPAIAQPADWEELAEEEELFLAAEKTRLNYVAATRGGSALVITVHMSTTKPKSKKESADIPKWSCRYLPEFRPGVTIADPLPEPKREPVAQPAAVAAPDFAALEAMDRERRRRRDAMLAESYRSLRAKPDADWGIASFGPGSGAGMELGEIVHRLLATDAKGDDLRLFAESLLREYQLPAEAAAELEIMATTARESPIWRRASRAQRIFREAPYSIPLEPAEGGGLQRGVIDLVFRERNGWVIVDYKSDNLPSDIDTKQAAIDHAAQLTAYARAWRRLTGEEVVETGIFFLRRGEYVVVPQA